MTKKLLITLSILTLFASCGTRGTDVQVQDPATFEEDVVKKTDVQVQDPATFDEGVVINGVRWATRNVDMPSTFAETPESFGMLFQWNRKKAWNAVEEEVEGWDSSIPEGIKWYAENDPCPEGWRVPTMEEFASLEDAGREWITKNGVNGRLFGTAPNQIFLPVVGLRTFVGALDNAGDWGWYWSSTAISASNAWYLRFNSNIIRVTFAHSANGFSVRCVSK